MIFSGTFKTFDNEQTYSITIGRSGTSQTIVDPTENIYGPAAPAMLVMFAPDPVTINCDRQDLMKRIIISQATINLYSNQDLTDYLFADTNRDIPVTISMSGNHVFFGYVDPLQFSQGYAYHYESITISATDPLGALEDKKVDASDATINPSAELSPWEIIETLLNRIGVTNITESINATVKQTMIDTRIHCTIFFGSSPDDWKSYYEVLETICKYFNLYIAMNGMNSVIISSTINNTVTAVPILNFKDKATDDSTSLSTDEAYSQVALTCNIEPVESIVTSFDDSDFLYSDYNDYEKYMTEYVSCGNNAKSWDAFYNMLHGISTTHNGAFTVDHYMYVLRNDKWDFGSNSYIDYLGGSINHTTGATTPMHNDQRTLLTWLAESPFKAALVGFAEMGKVMMNGTTRDNSLPRNPTLDKCLIISTNGDYDNSSTAFNRYQNLINNMVSNPLCKYSGIDANVLSPANSKTVNFIVINGSITLNPLQRLSGPNWSSDTDKLNNDWNTARDYFNCGSDNLFSGRIGLEIEVPYPGEAAGCTGDTAYYNQFWWYGSNIGGQGPVSGNSGVYGPLNISTNKELKYEYSKAGANDIVSKMPILCCQLKVTTTMTYPDDYPNESLRGQPIVKYCVERLDGGTRVHSWGSTGENNFEWLTLEECTQHNLSPIFTIGIDPKIDDYLIGQKFPISNSVDWRYNLDKTGTCIPIHMEDQLSGTIEFSIVCPYNAQWDNYVSFPTLFWPAGTYIYAAGSRSILSNIQSIMLSDLKIEMTSNNGGIKREKTGADNDLVYYSDPAPKPKYIEKLEDDVDICSWLTNEEYDALGIKIQNSNSYVNRLDLTDPENPKYVGFFGFNNGNVKPEACYVDYMYKEYNTPARILETQLTASTFSDGMYGNALNYEMLTNYFTGLPVIGNCRLMSYSSDLKYKTIDCKFRQHRTISNEQIPQI